MSSVALETSSLPSSGVGTQSATSNTNLSCLLKVKGTANRVAGAKRHELCGPKEQVSYFPRGTIHPWDDHPSTTMVLDTWRHKTSASQEELLIHETTTYRLLRYSTDGGISSLSPRRVIHPWDDNLPTTMALDTWRHKTSASQEEFLIHETTIHRLLWYSTQAETRSQSPKRSHPSTRWPLIDYYNFLPHENTKFSTS